MALEPWVCCSDVSQARRFYVDVLGFVVITVSAPSASESRHEVLSGYGGVLHLDSHQREGPFGHGFYVRVSDVDALHEQFLANGLPTESNENPRLRGGPVDQSWGMREIWLSDPDGNVVTFGEPLTAADKST